MVAAAEVESYCFHLSTDGQLPEKLAIQIQASIQQAVRQAEKEKS